MNILIFITGDCHGNVERFMNSTFPEQQCMTKNDYIIICGDFGLVWNYSGESEEEKYWLNWLDSRNFTTLFVDGNHENFERLNKYPVEEWNGGKVHKIRSSVMHLMRGELFEIGGKSFFTFEGAASHDIEDGILDMDEDGKWKITTIQWMEMGKRFRIRNLDWWDRELPSSEEIEHGLKNLKNKEYKVDYVITHCAPQTIVSSSLTRQDTPNILTNYFDELAHRVKFKKWFFGHYHGDKTIFGKFELLYERMIRID